MACTLAGAIANLILDPVFIFVFGMGVKGAAIATVLGQVITFVMSIIYLRRAKNFRIDGKSLKLKGKTVSGIVMKVFGIVVSIVIGISLGGQPIIGFNLGAGNLKRVRETILLITKLVLLVGAAALVIFEAAPDAIIVLFGNDNTPEYMEYARLCIRIFLGGIMLTCYIKSAAIMLQSMGNSVKSTLLALLRDVIIFVPASVIIAELSHSIVTMLWAALISDVIAAVIGFIFVRSEILKMDKTFGREK